MTTDKSPGTEYLRKLAVESNDGNLRGLALLAADTIDILRSRTEKAEAEVKRLQKDKTRLDAIASNYWDLICISVPTGGGDADVDWEVIEHHEGKKGNVIIAQAHTDDPRIAIDRALIHEAQEQDQ